MSMMCCERCQRLIDTDDHPETFRTTLNDACICESCMTEEEMMAEDDYYSGPGFPP